MEFSIHSQLQNLKYEPGPFKGEFEEPVENDERSKGEILWDFLRRVDNVIRMEAASYMEQAAVYPLEPILIAEMECCIKFNDRTHQMIGHMVRQVIERGFNGKMMQERGSTSGGFFQSGEKYSF